MHYHPISFLYRSLPLLALATLAAIVYWFVQMGEHTAANTTKKNLQHTVDYLAENFSVSILNEQGTTHYRIHGNKLAHYEDDLSYDVTDPQLRAFLPAQPQLTVRADFGTMSGDNEKIELFGNAQLLRDAKLSAQNTIVSAPLSARSDFFRLFPNKDILETDRPIELRHGASLINAVGATYNNVNRVLELHNNVQGQLHPLLPSP